MTREQKDLWNGINIIDWSKRHEQFLKQSVKMGVDRAELLKLHERKLSWLQHERLVHLLVTLLTSLIFMFSIWAWIETGEIAVSLFCAGLLILLTCYLIHYFRLENRVQHWYHIADELLDKGHPDSGNSE